MFFCTHELFVTGLKPVWANLLHEMGGQAVLTLLTDRLADIPSCVSPFLLLWGYLFARGNKARNYIIGILVVRLFDLGKSILSLIKQLRLILNERNLIFLMESVTLAYPEQWDTRYTFTLSFWNQSWLYDKVWIIGIVESWQRMSVLVSSWIFPSRLGWQVESKLKTGTTRPWGMHSPSYIYL